MGMADITGIKELEAAFERLRRTTGANVRRALDRCGAIAVTEARANAPISPTNKIVSNGLVRRKRTASRTTPGGLEKSIMHGVLPDGSGCSVYVASNSFAGAYAKRIHDGKGRTWWKRGPGTVAKGSRADDKFIERAIRDNADVYTGIFRDEIGKAAGSW